MKNQTKSQIVKMNRKTNCLNKTVKRTETENQIRTNPKPKIYPETETNRSDAHP